MKYLLPALSLFLGVVFNGRAYQANNAAETITSDGSYADTAQAVAYALGMAQDGWVLTVGAPGGTYNWTNALIIGTSNIFTIQGASANNRPTIILNTTANSGIYIGAGSSLVTIQNFIFNVGPNRPYSNLLGIDGSGVCFRVSNCEFLNASQINFGITIGSINSKLSAGPFGLVDNCQFFFPGGVVYNYINVRANGNVVNYGWTQPMSWGTMNSVVVESCAFSQPAAAPISGLVEADGGARLTVRYNTITNIPESTHGVNSGSHISTLQVECYENTWVLNDTNNTMPYVYLQRGGSGVIWSNVISSTSYWNASAIFSFWVEPASSSWQAEWFPAQLVYPANYPAYEQVGEGVLNGSPGLVPIFAWGNNAPNSQWGTFALGMNTDGPFIQQGRDIYTNSVMPTYTPLVYPHPLVTSGGLGSTNTNTGTNSGTGSMTPPSNLQAHAPTGQ
jgi:hypothetical protein